MKARQKKWPCWGMRELEDILCGQVRIKVESVNVVVPLFLVIKVIGILKTDLIEV